MAITQRPHLVRKAFLVGAVAIAATVVGAGSPVASAAPAAGTAVAGFTSLDTPANWAIVKQAATSGYFVPAKYSASCGAKQ